MLLGLLTGQHFKKQLPWESKMEVKNMLKPNQTQNAYNQAWSPPVQAQNIHT